MVMTPDGRALSISGNPKGLNGSWGFALEIRSQAATYRLQTSTRGSVEIGLIHDKRRASVTVREASYGEYTIASYEDPRHGGTQLVWLGDFHEVSMYVHGIDVPLELFVDRLRMLDIVDSRQGVTVRGRKGAGANVVYLAGANFVPELCGISVSPIETVIGDIPGASGRVVTGGELWRSDEVDERGRLVRRTLLLANRSTFCALTPFVPDDPDLVSLVESLDVRLN